MTTINFRGGRLPADPSRPHLELARLLHPELPAPPPSADWISTVPSGAWGMLGNDAVGDCTCAGVAHQRIGTVYTNQGETLAVTTAETLALYSAVTGYTPDDPSSDRGALCQTVLEYWRRHGFLGEKPVAFAKVDVSNADEVRQAISLVGQLYCGFDVPSSAMDQFDAGQPWDVVRGAQIEGGHCVTVGAYDADGLTCVTWGQTQRMTWRFFEKYFDEAWVVLGPDDINPATGEDRDKLNLAALEADFRALTGGSVTA